MKKRLFCFLIILLSAVTIAFSAGACDFLLVSPGSQMENESPFEDEKEIKVEQGPHEHVWSISTKIPTCQAQGYDIATCRICGRVEIGNYTKKVEHFWETKYSYDGDSHWYSCSYCGGKRDEEKHSSGSSGYCTDCGVSAIPSSGIIYDISNDGTYAEVVGYEGTDTKVLIADVYNGLPVKTICKEAFLNSYLISVVIPDSVTTIGERAFYRCSNLTCVAIGDGVISIDYEAFEYCNNLTSVKLGDSVTSIGSYAFSQCSDLTSVVIPDSVISIMNGSFYGCSDLERVVIGENVTSMGSAAFRYCNSLMSIEIPNSVTSIGSAAFDDCEKLQFREYGNCKYLGSENNPYFALIEVTKNYYKSYAVHEQTKLIADYALYDCVRMTSISIPNSVMSIGEWAFNNCDNLFSVELGKNVKMIGEYAFAKCYRLVEVVNKSPYITIESGYNVNGGLGNNALAIYNSNDTFTGTKIINEDGYIIYTDGREKILVGYLGGETELVLPSYITKINDSAFYDCTNLMSVIIGDNITSIGEGAFQNCASLKTIVIPYNVTFVEYNAFAYCNSLTIYCETQIVPNTWDNWWNSSNRPVVWGYTGSEE